ncbi:MAG: sulfatase/phosphatase domain-containing protein, partial [Pirellulales bacterium]
WWPGKIKAGSVSHQVASTMDIFATAQRLVGVEPPSDRTLDSFDLSPVLFNNGPSKRRLLFYYRGYNLMAVRKGPWKAHFMTQAAYGQQKPEQHDPPILYHLEHDPSETQNLADKHAEVIADIRKEVESHKRKLKPAPSQLEL